MVRIEFGRLVVGVGALALGASMAMAQDNIVVGNPQLRDFSLPVQERIVTQPAPTPAPPVQVAPPSPVNPQPQATPPRASPPPAAARPAPAQTTLRPQPAPVQQQAPSAPTIQAPPATALPPASDPVPAPSQPPVSIPAETADPEGEGGFPWLYLVPVAAIALLAFAFLRRRRRSEEIGYVVEDASAAPLVPAAPPPPRRDPGERPWVELELRTNRASFTATEANLNFELEIRNSGKVPAQNLRVDVKLFNAGAEQDKEIGAFFRTAGRETTRLNLPGVPPGATGVIQGEVGLPIEQMRAVQLDGRTLFIPVIAVNALYDCGDGRTGQSSKSYVVGRELQETADKMGAFRVDQGPRIWRTVGQRQHKLARRI